MPTASAQDDLDVLLGESRTESEMARPEPTPLAPSAPEGPVAEGPQSETAEPAVAKPEPVSPQATTGVRKQAVREIEEIIVTAQKRAEPLHEVPISMSVMDEEFMAQQNITDLREVALNVPNVTIDLNGIWITPRIRGFSVAPLQRGGEQVVGLVIDGIAYSRGEYFQTGLFDLDRVEVLRGPQGTLFGKNTTVGLLNVVTKKPTDEFTGFIDLQGGELARRRVEGAIGGPLIKNLLNFRFAGITDERNGYLTNTTAAVEPVANERSLDRTREAVRFQLESPNFLGADLGISYEHADGSLTGTGNENFLMPSKFRAFFRQFDPNANFEPWDYVTSVDAPERSTMSVDSLAGKASYSIGEWALDAVAGWSSLSTRNLVDADNTPAPVYLARIDEVSPQTTFELRMNSPRLPGLFGREQFLGLSLGATDFTAGVFYQRQELRPSRFVVQLNSLLVSQIIAISQSPSNQEAPPLPTAEGGADLSQFVETVDLLFNQTSNSVAGFGQVNWHLTDRWTLLSGTRLSFESKDGSWVNHISPDTAVLVRAQTEDFTQTLSRSELDFSPKLGLKYDWTDDVNLFATWARGFRGGGFNTLNAQSNPSSLQFGKETVQSWEVGSKMTLLGGAATMNLGLFWMNDWNFQLVTSKQGSVLPESLTVNVGEIRSRGVETDFAWLPASWLTIRAAVGLDDTKYLDFPIGPCLIDRQGPGGVCDLTGRPLMRAPKWNGTVTPLVRFPLTSIPGVRDQLPGFLTGVNWTTGVTAEYQDNQYLNATLDPRTRMPSFFRFNGNLGFANAEHGWSLGLSVENLTNKAVASDRSPVAEAAGVINQILDPPRLFVGRFRWGF